MKRSLRILTAAGAAVALLLAPAAMASAISLDTPGPLVRIEITETLNCAVNHAGDSSGEFFDDTACGTFVALGDDLFGPGYVPAGVNGSPAWTPVSQQATGTGSAADPHQIVTTVTGGPLSLTQTDTYINGEHHYTTESVVTNNSDDAVDITLYHAADCYLGDQDYGFGAYDAATGAVSCVARDSEGLPSAASRIEQFIPLTSGSNYLYGSYWEVWDAVAARVSLPDEIRDPETVIDNGMALSWTVTIAAGESASFTMLTNFSPLDITQLTTSLQLVPTSAVVNEEVTATATILNPNDAAQELSVATVTLPAGLEYVAGSADGVEEPTLVNGQLLFNGAGAQISSNGSLQFSFQLITSAVGNYTLELSAAVESRIDVLPSSAQLAVQLPVVNSMLSVNPDTIEVNGTSTLEAHVFNDHDFSITLDEVVITLPDGAVYTADSAVNIAEPTVDGMTLRFAGPFTINPGESLRFSFEVEATVAGDIQFALTGTSAEATVLPSQVTLSVETAVVTPDPPRSDDDSTTLANTGASFASQAAIGSIAGALLLVSAAVLGGAAVRRKAQTQH